MKLLANDLTVHKKFHDMTSFRDALGRWMTTRKVAQRFGQEMYCHRTLLAVSPMPDDLLKASVSPQLHGLLATGYSGTICVSMARITGRNAVVRFVTDSAVGESAFRALNGVDCALVGSRRVNLNALSRE